MKAEKIFVVGLIILIIALVAGVFVLALRETGSEEYEEETTHYEEVAEPSEVLRAEITPDGEDIVIQKNEITENITFFPVIVEGRLIEMGAVRDEEGIIRTAFNTCEFCLGAPRAYFVQRGRSIQCQACGNIFEIERFGVYSGGCNPVPITKEYRIETEETIVITHEFLRENRDLFLDNWRAE